MNTMIYKGCAARIEYSEEDGCFVGHLAGIRDIVGFDAQGVDDLEERFHKAVDDYLWGCEQLGSEPIELSLNGDITKVQLEPSTPR